jgi:imidazole glycerol-phosphate synthase subunit HisF
MLKKRVIFTLHYDRGFFMLSRNFRLQKVGDLDWLKINYNFSQIACSIDEVIVLDVSRGPRDEDKFYSHVRSLTEECFVPIAAGGGIRTLEQARVLLHSGADKVVVNSLVDTAPDVITEIVTEFGGQCVIASVDAKKIDDRFVVFTENGDTPQATPLDQWLTNLIDLSVGELYLNSIDRDGTGQGYHKELLEYLPKEIPIPVILAGGAGHYHHLAEGLMDDRVDAVATAHLFNFVADNLEKSRKSLLENGFNLATWNVEVAARLEGSMKPENSKSI